MKNFLDHREISNFKNFIEKEFPKTPFFEFAITNIDFNSNERLPELRISIEHYEKEKRVIFNFKNFIYYFVTNESYQPWFESDPILNISYFEILKSDKSKDDKNLKEYLEKDLEYAEVYKFRLIAQNFMIDVFSSIIPEILIQ